LGIVGALGARAGGLGALPGGGGGAAAGKDEATDPDGFLDAGGGRGGFFPIGGAGLGFGGVDPVDDIEDTEERKPLRNCATLGTVGAEPGGRRGAPPGTLGAEGTGGAARVVSGSERYEA
jgi:hypothetical protein